MYRVEVARDFGFVYTYESIEEALKGIAALILDDGCNEDEITLMQVIPFKVEVKVALP